MKRKVIVPIVIVALIALDQWVKFEIVKNIQLGGVKPFIPKILSLTICEIQERHFQFWRTSNGCLR